LKPIKLIKAQATRVQESAVEQREQRDTKQRGLI